MKKLLITGITTAAMMSTASAAVTLTLSGTSGSNVLNYEISGSGVFDGNSGGQASFTFVINSELLIDGFENQAWGFEPGEHTGSGNLTNTTDSVSASISRIGLTNGSSNDSITIDFVSPPAPPIESGDTYTFNASGTITINTFYDTGINSVPFDFDYLVQGAHTATDGSGPFDGFTINVQDASAIPEPSSAALFGLAGLGMLMRRRRSN